MTRCHSPHLSVCILRTKQNTAPLHRHTIRGRSGGASCDPRCHDAVHRNYSKSTPVNPGRECVPHPEHPIAIAQILVWLKPRGLYRSILRCTRFPGCPASFLRASCSFWSPCGSSGQAWSRASATRHCWLCLFETVHGLSC